MTFAEKVMNIKLIENSSRFTVFILVICSSEIVVVTLFTKFTYLL